MNDLDVVAGFRADVAPADPHTLDQARARMLAETAVAAPRARRGIGWRLAPVAALAAAVAVAVVAVQQQPAEQKPEPGHQQAQRPEAPTEARTVLRLAAAEAGAQPVLPARDDQYVFFESFVRESTLVGKGSKPVLQLPIAKNRRVWLSVDGSRPGLLREKPDTNEVDGWALEGAGYQRKLPTDTATMRKYLFTSAAKGKSAEQHAFATVGDLLGGQYVPPASVAAMFEALSTVDGVTVLKDAEDAAGRRGIAVSWYYGSSRTDLIFDRVSYKYLGTRTVQIRTAGGIPAGALIYADARIKVAVVDKTGRTS